MRQFQINKSELDNTRIVAADLQEQLTPGQVLVEIERFGFSSNNITYAVAGETIGYWKFFKALENQTADWGILPVWGFAKIVQSSLDALPEGERLFGYFPPATHLVMSPIDVSAGHFFDGAEHRSELPRGYNIYRRVEAEPGYNSAGDDLRMLLYPLYITSFSLWDYLKENAWFGAEQIALVSASSKTSVGLAYALEADADAPPVVGLTSNSNAEFVGGLGIYDTCITYDAMEESLPRKKTVIVDMAGNSAFLGDMHAHLGGAMLQTVNVGITHWENFAPNQNIIKERSAFFFAPSQIQKRMKEWGAEEFGKRSSTFFVETCRKSQAWLNLSPVDGLDGLSDIFDDVLNGRQKPEDGLIVDMNPSE